MNPFKKVDGTTVKLIETLVNEPVSSLAIEATEKEEEAAATVLPEGHAARAPGGGSALRPATQFSSHRRPYPTSKPLTDLSIHLVTRAKPEAKISAFIHASW